jgi:hypothetical protein
MRRVRVRRQAGGRSFGTDVSINRSTADSMFLFWVSGAGIGKLSSEVHHHAILPSLSTRFGGFSMGD